MVAVGLWLIPPPLSAIGLEQIAQLGVDGLKSTAQEAGASTVESQIDKFCKPLRGAGNMVSKPIVAVALSETSNGTEWQRAYETAFNRSKIEILKFRTNQIKASNQDSLQSDTTNGQTEMKSQATIESASQAAASLVGLTVVASSVGTGENNQPSLGLCVIANRDLQDLIAKLARSPAEIKINPPAISPLDIVDSQTPQNLSKQFGIRLFSDPAGHPIIIAFGQAAVSYKGTSEPIRAKFRQVSATRAEAIADQQIAEYLAGEAIYSDQLLSSQLNEISTGDSSETQKTDTINKIASDLSSRVKVNLTGLSTVRRWTLPASKNAPEMIGIVRLWQPIE